MFLGRAKLPKKHNNHWSRCSALTVKWLFKESFVGDHLLSLKCLRQNTLILTYKIIDSGKFREPDQPFQFCLFLQMSIKHFTPSFWLQNLCYHYKILGSCWTPIFSLKQQSLLTRLDPHRLCKDSSVFPVFWRPQNFVFILLFVDHHVTRQF